MEEIGAVGERGTFGTFAKLYLVIMPYIIIAPGVKIRRTGRGVAPAPRVAGEVQGGARRVAGAPQRVIGGRCPRRARRRQHIGHIRIEGSFRSRNLVSVLCIATILFLDYLFHFMTLHRKSYNPNTKPRTSPLNKLYDSLCDKSFFCMRSMTTPRALFITKSTP